METDPNDPISPNRETWINGNNEAVYGGLTKREYFAGLAMQSLIPTYVEEIKELTNAASAAVSYADALIEALNKEDTND